MPRSATSRAALLLVLVLLAVPALQAAPNRPDAEAALAPTTWELFTQVWDFLTGVWSSNGCEFDPDGRCLPRPTTFEVDNGCEFDPSGRCGN